VKDLSVGQHPVAIHQEQNWRKFQPLDGVVCELVVKRRWLFGKVGNKNSLTKIRVEVPQSSNWE
jgi:hypothetical protein